MLWTLGPVPSAVVDLRGDHYAGGGASRHCDDAGGDWRARPSACQRNARLGLLYQPYVAHCGCAGFAALWSRPSVSARCAGSTSVIATPAEAAGRQIDEIVATLTDGP
jgi:hypothetical protein